MSSRTKTEKELLTELEDLRSQLQEAEQALKDSKQRYRSLVELSPDAIAVHSEGEYVYINHSGVKLFGVTEASEIVGKKVLDLVHPDYQKIVSERIQLSYEQKIQTPIIESKIVRLDGRSVDVEAMSTPITYMGKPATQLVLRDITERKKAEEALHAKQAEFRLIADTTPVLLTRLSRDLKYVFVNRACAEMFGRTQEEIIGKSIVEIMGKEAFETIRPYVEKVLQGEFVEYETKIPYQEIGSRFMHVVYVPERNEQGDVVGWFASVFDISKRKQAEQALRESQQDLDRAQKVAYTGSWRLDVQKNKLTWSDENHRIFGIPKGTTMTYETFLSTVHPDDREYVDKKWKAGLSGKHYDIEHRIIVEGQIKCVREKAYLEFDKNGELLGGFGITQDITERKQMENEIRQARDELEIRVKERTAELDKTVAALQKQVQQRIQAEETVKAERQQLYDVLDTLPAYVVLLSPDYHVPFANRFFEERFGKSNGQRCYEYLFNRTEPCEICETYSVLKTNAPHHWEWTGPDGRNYDIYDFPFKDTDGSNLIMEVGLDITERKQAEEALHSHIKKEEVVAELGQLALKGIDLSTLMGKAVSYITKTLGMEYCKVLELLPDGKALLLRAGVGWKKGLVGSATVSAGTESQAGYTLTSNKPVIVEDLRTEMRFSGSPLLYDNGVVSGISVIIEGWDRPFGVLSVHTAKQKKFTKHDIHFLNAVSSILAMSIKRQMAEEELIRSHEQFRNLSAHLQSVREEERTNIAREIHDELGQSLTALKIDVSMLANKFYPDHKPLVEKSETIMKCIDETIQAVKKICSELRPTILDHFGIAAAIEWQANEFQERTGLKCKVTCMPEDVIIDRDVSIVLFRIFQETLTNVMRHSGATEVRANLEKKDSMIMLEVKDNGKGITDEEIFNSKSFGLLGMRERVNFLGGDLIINGEPDRGTTIKVTIPLYKK